MAKKCPTCRSDNPDTLKFCGECGTQRLPSQAHSPVVTETLEGETALSIAVKQRGEIVMDIKSISRRHFMKYAMAGMGGYIGLSSTGKKHDENQKERKFVYRTLGKTGIKVPVIGMGMLLSDKEDLLRAAIEAGITHFDTTAGLPQQLRNEELIGKVLSGRPRESYVFGPKIHLPRNQSTSLYGKTATEQEFLKILDASLKRLRMDYVDILYHHDVSRKESALYEPIMKAMEKAKKQGKTRFLGLTTHRNVAEAVQAAVDSNFYEVVMAAYNFRQKDQLRIKAAIAKAAEAGLGVVAIKVIRGGFDEYDKPTNPTASLKWVLQDPHVHATVPGFSTYEEMNADLSVMENLSLTDAERKDLQRAVSGAELYCQGCGRCLEQCPAELPIPDLMRAYMYAYGYRQPALAQSLLASLDLPQQACEGCSSCPVVCLNQWDIGEKVRCLVRGFPDVH